MKIGDKIKLLRTNKKISQKDLAKKLDMPVSTLANYENNHRDPSVKVLVKICKALDTDLNLIVNDESLSTQRTLSLMKKKSISENELSEKLSIPLDIVNEFIHGKKILTKNDYEIAGRISDLLQVSYPYLTNQSDWKHYEDEEIHSFSLIFNAMKESKVDKIKLLSRDILEILHLTLYSPIYCNKEVELTFLYEFYKIIYSLRNTLDNDANLKCYGDTVGPFKLDYKPLNNAEIHSLANDSKIIFNNLVDNFIKYYTDLESWKKDFNFNSCIFNDIEDHENDYSLPVASHDDNLTEDEKEEVNRKIEEILKKRNRK